MFLERYTAVLFRYRWLTVIVSTAIMLAMAAGAGFITTSNDQRTLFSKDNPQLLIFDALEATYAVSNNVLIAVAPQTGSVFTRDALAAIEDLTEAGWQTPHSTRVVSLTNYIHSAAEGDELRVGPLVKGARSLSDDDLKQVEKIALGEAELAGRLVALDGRVGGVIIDFVMPDDQDRATIEITDHLDSLLNQARADHPGINYYAAGHAITDRAFATVSQDDLGTLTPIVFLVIIAVAIVLLRSVLTTVAVVFVLFFVLATTMGFAGWVGAVFDPISASMPLMVLVIAIGDSIHVVSGTLQAMRRGLDRNAAITESLRLNAYPVFLTSVTTAIGFLSLNTAASPPFHTLGNFAAFGVLCAFLYSLIFLPALLSILPLRPRLVPSTETTFFDRFADFLINRRVPVLLSMTTVVVVLAIGIFRIEFGDNLRQMFDEQYPIRRDATYIGSHLTGLDQLEYSLRSGREGGITDSDYLRKVEAFAEWYREQSEVIHVQAFTDIVKRLNRNMHGDDPAYHRLPDAADLTAQYLLLYELSLPFGSDLNDRINVKRSATRMTVVIEEITAPALRRLDARAQAWIRANAPGLTDEATGMSVVGAHLAEQNFSGMLSGTGLALALISFILIGVFRSVKIGLISLLPNFVPLIMTFGLWGHFVGQMGFVVSAAVAITFGIIVDDTIHFLSKYLEARRAGRSASEAVRSTFRKAGHALWTTTAILVAGFLVFYASGFEPSWVLGVIVALTAALALVADFLFLSTLLIVLDQREARS